MKKVLFLIMSLLLTSCSIKLLNSSLKIDEVTLDYGNISLSEVEEIKEVSSLEELSNFMDYVAYSSKNDEVKYAKLTNEFKEELLDNFDYIYSNAGQQGILSHNFIKGYNLSRIDENLFGVFGSINKYGFKSYSLKENNHKVIKIEYFLNVLNKNKEKENSLKELSLYRNNNGFIKANNSEEIFYLLSHNYFPVIENNKGLEELFSKMCGIVFALIDENMSEKEKYFALYNYIVNENTYDYDSFNYKDSLHTYYECYFLEGSILSQNAVCDGMVKALVSLARLSGIEAYHVGASNGESGHAYLYVKLDNTYYLSSPTDGKKVYQENGKKYHLHTNSFYLTNYFTNNPDWDFYSLAHPEIIEELKLVEPYDYYKNEEIVINGETYNFEINDLDKSEKLLKEINDLAKENNLPLEIELKGNIDEFREIIANLKDFSYFVIDNGYFGGELLKSFVFNYA